MSFFELPSLDHHKSHWGKALVFTNNSHISLKSYDTIVCSIDKEGNFHRYWIGYSSTTQRHINSFRKLYNLPTISKEEWEELPVERREYLL